MAISFLGVGITVTVSTYTSQAVAFYSSIRSMVDSYRGLELAHAGIEAGLLSLGSLQEEYLFTLGIVSNPPRILLSEKCNDLDVCHRYYTSYSIQPEDGKLNLNHLVRTDDEPNGNFYRIFSRLFEVFQLDPDLTGAVIDWIDQNNSISTGGAEQDVYGALAPPRKIKNAPLYSLSELGAIQGFNHNIIYVERAPASFAQEREERAALSQEEEYLLQSEDWVLANHITAYIPRKLLGSEKISVNAARYHTLYSLSNVMGRREISAILRLRQKNNGYIKKKELIQKLPELQVIGSTGTSTLADELLGADKVSGFLTTSSRFFRITGIGFVTVASDNDEKTVMIRRVWAIWDNVDKEMIYYAED